VNINIDHEELNLLRYACCELANRRAEQAIDGRKLNSEWADANEKEARKYRILADKISDLQRQAAKTVDTLAKRQ
jgi:hypothetical protein